ncbi:MAG: M3 family metallopeptidase [Myxococcales bacterium]|nr:M3 family metallopeptidase [Polyangiaceae bacterium]MDW8248969.1 M3 family metallopeptidase [Myxococcales bacterium]
MNSPANNPLLAPWETLHELPPFDRIRPEHFAPALEVAMAEHRRELDAIASSKEAPSFANTVAAFDRSGKLLARVGLVFWNLTASETSPALQEIEREWAPRLAAHQSATYLDERLFERVAAVHAGREGLGLDEEERRLVDRVYLDFVLAGAKLPAASKKRAAAIQQELASLYTEFAQNVLADEASFELELVGDNALAGLPDFVVAAAQSAAAARGKLGSAIITLSRSLVVPFLTYSERRDLRELAFRAWTRRGELSTDRDNLEIARKILGLRQELAALHGAASYADYALQDTMAGSKEAVLQLLHRVWGPARRRAQAELAQLQAMADELGDDVEIAPWDWRYYAEKVRAKKYQLDDGELKPYLELGRMRAAMFAVAERLFGLKIERREGVALYHPEVECFEVKDGTSGALIGVFLSDNFARPSKRGGAWMNSYREQQRGPEGAVTPVVVNNNNFARAPEGQPTLLSLDDLRTMFHEFGHGLHGLLSEVTYARLSGTNVLRDFVELPSQLMEHWAFRPEVLREHARHVETGEPIPDELIARMKRAMTFNQGFDAVEYTASALVDMELHARSDAGSLDLATFEKEILARLEMPSAIVMRHRLPHFLHLFSGPEYAAGYYVYLWAAVLDNDAFDAFEEAGDIFDPATAARLRKYIYSSGNRLEPGAAYRAFRGRDPDPTPMLRNRGLLEGATTTVAAD